MQSLPQMSVALVLRSLWLKGNCPSHRQEEGVSPSLVGQIPGEVHVGVVMPNRTPETKSLGYSASMSSPYAANAGSSRRVGPLPPLPPPGDWVGWPRPGHASFERAPLQGKGVSCPLCWWTVGPLGHKNVPREP